MEISRTDVLIAGAGMAGATAALACAHAGLRVVLVDPLPFETQVEPTFDGRASALTVAAPRLWSGRVEAATQETGLGVIAITHYKRLLDELRPDFVHVLAKGVIQRTGGPELAEELERTGYAQWIEPDMVETPVHLAGFGDDPFADPFA